MVDHMIALFVPPADRAKLLDLIPESLRQYAQPADQLHLTLLHWEQGEEMPPEAVESYLQGLAPNERYQMPMNGKVQGWGVFEKEAVRVLYLSFDHPGLPGLREAVASFAVPGVQEHGFTPHITLAYLPAGTPIPDLSFAPFELEFDRIYLASGDKIYSAGAIEGVREVEKSLETPFELAKSVTDLPDGDLEIIVKGVPFGGPEYLHGNDFHGERFSKATDVGPLRQVLSYFHHGKDPLFGKDPLGLANRLSDEEAKNLGLDPDEAVFYRVIVSKAAKYKNAIKALAENNWLGASSTPFQNTAEKDVSGHWNKWHVVEVALTYSPANPLAVTVLEKSLGDTMKTSKKDAAQEVPETPIEESAPDTQSEVEDNPIVAAIEKAFEAPAEETEVSDTTSQLADLEQRLTQRIDDAFAKLEKSLGNIEVALPLLAQKMAGKVKNELERDLGKSAAEREVETQIRRKVNTHIDPKLPVDAPGNW